MATDYVVHVILLITESAPSLEEQNPVNILEKLCLYHKFHQALQQLATFYDICAFLDAVNFLTTPRFQHVRGCSVPTVKVKAKEHHAAQSRC